MHSKILKTWWLVCSLICLLHVTPMHADISFPARLEITEETPGVYKVFFVLPVVNGKVQKAQPIFPEGFTLLSKPTIDGDNSTKRMQWRAKYDATDLSGLKFGIDGLLGSQTDIFFMLSQLNGRVINTKLSPSQAFFIIPDSPTFTILARTNIYKGLQFILAYLPLYFISIFLILYMKKATYKRYLSIAIISAFFGLWLGYNELILMPTHILSNLGLAIAAILALRYFYKPNVALNKVSSTLSTALIGLGLGACFAPQLDILGLSNQQTFSGIILGGIGLALGVLLVFLFSKEAVYLVNLISKGKKQWTTEKFLSYSIGILAFGLLIYECSLYGVAPSMLPQIPLAIITFCIISGIILNTLEGAQIKNILLLILPLLAGLILGLWGWSLPYLLIIILSCVLYLTLYYYQPTFFNTMTTRLVLVLGSLASGLYLANYASDHLSYATSQATGFYVILLLIFIFSWRMSGMKSNSKKIALKPIFLIGLGFLVLVLWGQHYINPEWQQLQTNLAMGKLSIPLLSLCLLVFGFIFWPRYKKVHKAMNISRKKPIVSLCFLGMALLCLPLTVKASNPWYNIESPKTEDIKQIMQAVLSNTYKAFNIEDEAELFETLSESLDENLIDNVYLDSRRRLNVGLKEGSEVHIETVTVEDIGEALPRDTGEHIFEYPTEWIVTARVKHLQHIHYRQNKYIGTVALTIEDDGWKIYNITLTSEDRTIIAAKNK
ncbi:hypothetical protein Q4566_13875 [Tamlana sp. 2_MG-2023]|uniref:hypothetical protein n=1 Tax=unclassified Tamlana TaxID=2614803 RepID=UPI0026E2CA63|nr:MULTISPECIES: hypothetical protein [unclassified Tamlana]MDO6761295.1 hypothetical protein [Tamlana sp. 2_MG-2023]MDO6791778.1 hypothetical protein [Tamlana sp. 1_MG-2023]